MIKRFLNLLGIEVKKEVKFTPDHFSNVSYEQLKSVSDMLSKLEDVNDNIAVQIEENNNTIKNLRDENAQLELIKKRNEDFIEKFTY